MQNILFIQLPIIYLLIPDTWNVCACRVSIHSTRKYRQNDVEVNFSVRQGEIVVTKAEEVWERFWVLLQAVDEIAFSGRMLEA